MGNVLTMDTAKSSSDYQDDLKWLSVQNDAIFNDSYLAEVFESLPQFEGTIIPEEKAAPSEENYTPKMMRIKRLVQIFSAYKEGVTCVENFEVMLIPQFLVVISYTRICHAWKNCNSHHLRKQIKCDPVSSKEYTSQCFGERVRKDRQMLPRRVLWG